MNATVGPELDVVRDDERDVVMTGTMSMMAATIVITLKIQMMHRA